MEEQTQDAISGKLEKLMHITREIACCLDESEVLKKSLELETDIVDAETGSILLLDESGEYLTFSVALGDDKSVLKDHRVKVGEGIAGYVAEEKEPVLVEDARTDDRFYEYFDDQTGFETESVLCVPIQSGDELLGVAEVINKVNGSSFTEDDLLMFSAFAGQIAVALENARLHEEVVSKERVEQEIEMAREVQNSYLPDELPDFGEISFGASLDPAQMVSGDFYDYFQVSDQEVAFLIGDVSGKGMASAMHMCRALTELRTRLKNNIPTAEVMGTVNNRLVETSTQGMFVTMILFLINKEESTIEVANAGHLPFFERIDGTLKKHHHDHNPPLGILSDTQFEIETLELTSNTQITAFTDGITEAKNSEGTMFGLDRTEEMMQKTRLPAELLVGKLKDTIRDFRGTVEQKDDMTVVSFETGDLDQNYEFEIVSKPSYLELVRNAVSHLLKDTEFARDSINPIQVGVDEAVSNIIEHTYHHSETGQIDVSMRLEDKTFTCSFRDYGEKVDPSKLKGKEQIDQDEVEPGGLGLHLMSNIFDEFEYDSDVENGNKLILTKEFDTP